MQLDEENIVNKIIPQPPDDIQAQVTRALEEDVGGGDISASLLPNSQSVAGIICNQKAVICGQPWVNEVYAQIDSEVRVDWQITEGQSVLSSACCAYLTGPTRAILTGERTALNFLQLLSGTATMTQRYAGLIADSKTTLLDTRKTIPGLRRAQKYAVLCGGGENHRIGLFDAILIKENHIQKSQGIGEIVAQARQQSPKVKVEVEVENLSELALAISAHPDIIMLDNFSLPDIKQAVKLNAQRIKLEVSGGVTEESLLALAATGVDYISVGALTKDLDAVDFSLRVSD